MSNSLYRSYLYSAGVVLPIMAISLFFGISALGESLNIAGIAEKWHGYFSALQAIQFKYSYSYPIHNPTPVGKAIAYKDSGVFYFDSPRFAFDITTETPELHLPSNKSYFSYDGSDYKIQVWGPELQMSKDFTKLGTDAKSFMLHLPLLYQFLFLYSKDRDFNLEALRLPETWARFAAHATLQGEKIIDGKKMLCVLSKREGGITDTLYLYPPLSFYPMILETDGPAGKAISTVIDYKRVNIDDQILIIPTLVNVNNFFPHGAPHAFTSVYKIDEKSIMIGGKLPPEVLTPPYTQAAVTHDVDLNVYIDQPRSENVDNAHTLDSK